MDIWRLITCKRDGSCLRVIWSLCAPAAFGTVILSFQESIPALAVNCLNKLHSYVAVKLKHVHVERRQKSEQIRPAQLHITCVCRDDFFEVLYFTKKGDNTEANGAMEEK